MLSPLNPYNIINSIKTVNQWQQSITSNTGGSVKYGYKQMDVMFGPATLSQEMRPHQGVTGGIYLPEVGFSPSHTYIDFTQGELTYSNNKTHLAINGEGFFTLSDHIPINTIDGTREQIAEDMTYTRNGEFFKDVDELWRDNNGNYLLASSSLYDNAEPLDEQFTEIQWAGMFNSYDYRQQVEVVNNDGFLVSGTKFNGGPINGIGDAATVRLKVRNSQINSDFSDIRIGYDDSGAFNGTGWVELGRNVIEVSDDGTFTTMDITFKLYNDILPGEKDRRYFIYHGDPGAVIGVGFPNDPTAGALYADNFNQYPPGSAPPAPYSVGPVSPGSWGFQDVWESNQGAMAADVGDQELVHVMNSGAANPLQEAFIFNGTSSFNDYRFALTAGKFVDDGRTVGTANNATGSTFYDNDELYFYFRHNSRGENYRLWVSGSGGPFYQPGAGHTAPFTVGVDKLYLDDPGLGAVAGNIKIANLYQGTEFNLGPSGANAEIRPIIEVVGDTFFFSIEDTVTMTTTSLFTIQDNGIDMYGNPIVDNMGNTVAPYLSGGIGLGLHSQAAYFDDLLVEELDPPDIGTDVLSFNGILKAFNFPEDYINLSDFPARQSIHYDKRFGDLYFQPTIDSGNPQIYQVGSDSVGSVHDYTLEASNVNMQKQMLNLTGVNSISDVLSKQFKIFIDQVDIGLNLIR